MPENVIVEVSPIVFTALSIDQTRYWYDLVPRCSWLCPAHHHPAYVADVTEAMTEVAEYSAN